LQSKVNGATYHGEQLARQKWIWPQDTYFQQRLCRAKWYQIGQKEVELAQRSRLANVQQSMLRVRTERIRRKSCRLLHGIFKTNSWLF
jgi:hypothetical protein